MTIVQWNDARGRTEGAGSWRGERIREKNLNGLDGLAVGSGHDHDGATEDGEEVVPRSGRGARAAKLLETAPESVRTAWGECEQLRHAIDKNNNVKRSIAKRGRRTRGRRRTFDAQGCPR